MSDPPAPDLGAIRERLEASLAYHESCGDPCASEVETPDLRALLAAFDAQAARLAAQQPVMDAVLKLSTYSRETVDAGVQRIVETLGDYEDWLLADDTAGAGKATDGAV